jgi:hypothetical protein
MTRRAARACLVGIAVGVPAATVVAAPSAREASDPAGLAPLAPLAAPAPAAEGTSR